MSRGPWVLHVDLDQFIAAVEVLRHPELVGLPVVVGGNGDPTRRSVVATASYEARQFGVRSGLPMRVAARRCPDAVFLPHDRAAYEQASAEVMVVLRDFAEIPVAVEILGWDEAFLGSATQAPQALARQAQRAVLAATGLWLSVGVGDNLLRAKMATDFAKPRGVFTLTADNWFEVMGDRPTDALWGIGRKTAGRLKELGFITVDQLAGADPARLGEQVGPTMGPRYVGIARGQGRTQVASTPYLARAHSREITFQEDLEDWTDVRDQVRLLAGQLAVDVGQEGRLVTRVGLKVRFAPFATETRSATLPAPTAGPAEITGAAIQILERFDRGRPVRLLGVRAEFQATDQPRPANPGRGRGGLGGDAT